MKKIMMLCLLISVAVFGYYAWNEMCRSSPECACKSAQPGDPTCLDPKQLDEWCQQQSHKNELPQCNL